MKKLPKELRSLVNQAVSTLGQVIRQQAGTKVYNKVEKIRSEMKELRNVSDEQTQKTLSRLLAKLRKEAPETRLHIAHAFSLMMELINTCETAYRTFRLRQRESLRSSHAPNSITYVVTAHPTEARSPQLITLFQQIQMSLISALDKQEFTQTEQEIEHLLNLCWVMPLSRHQKPTVADEAESVFAIVLRQRSVLGYIELFNDDINFKIRSWIGGDKDGHPGVNESITRKCLSLSRSKLIDFLFVQLSQIEEKLKVVLTGKPQADISLVLDKAKALRANLNSCRSIESKDGQRVSKFKTEIEKFAKFYAEKIGSLPIELSRISDLMQIFPALVVPLELRESAAVFAETYENRENTQILGMLKTLKQISQGGQLTWYVAGIVVSHTEEVEDLIRVIGLQKRIFGKLSTPVVPLFESEAALVNGKSIIKKYISHPEVKSSLKTVWNQKVEVMVGYSDSAKQSGTLPSRLMISRSIHGVSEVLTKAKLTPVFFHGSGGSVARGGGSLQEQTEWWPQACLDYFKMTVQGEMIQRSFASREILARQIQKISDNLQSARPKHRSSKAIEEFSETVKQNYRSKITNKDFLNLVATATPYRFLRELKIGSRPSKRSQDLAFESLRAIPWVLCWTQTRILFPVWWGVGTAWKMKSKKEKQQLADFFQQSPLFRSYVKMLGFTLEKIEPSIFSLYLNNSSLPKSQIEETLSSFHKELRATRQFVRHVSGEKDLVWFRPWLRDSITLRSSMIHPLNVLQVIAIEESDSDLLRETVTGIACGMMTTG